VAETIILIIVNCIVIIIVFRFILLIILRLVLEKKTFRFVVALRNLFNFKFSFALIIDIKTPFFWWIIYYFLIKKILTFHDPLLITQKFISKWNIIIYIIVIIITIIIIIIFIIYIVFLIIYVIIFINVF
jgi:hypothetical protein